MFVMGVDASVTSLDICSTQSTMPLATSTFFVPCESKGDTKANKFVGCPLWSNIPFNFTKHRLAARYGLYWVSSTFDLTYIGNREHRLVHYLFGEEGLMSTMCMYE